jgi:hypothetical protein
MTIAMMIASVPGECGRIEAARSQKDQKEDGRDGQDVDRRMSTRSSTAREAATMPTEVPIVTYSATVRNATSKETRARTRASSTCRAQFVRPEPVLGAGRGERIRDVLLVNLKCRMYWLITGDRTATAAKNCEHYGRTIAIGWSERSRLAPVAAYASLDECPRANDLGGGAGRIDGHPSRTLRSAHA